MAKSKIGLLGRIVVKAVRISTSINERAMNHYIQAIKTTTKATNKTKRMQKFPKKREYTSMPVLANTFYVLHSSGMDKHSSVLVTGIEQSVFYTKAGNVRKQFSQYLTQEKENQTKFGKNLFVFADKIEKLIPVLEKKTGFTFGGHFKMSKNSKGETTFSFFSLSIHNQTSLVDTRQNVERQNCNQSRGRDNNHDSKSTEAKAQHTMSEGGLV